MLIIWILTILNINNFIIEDLVRKIGIAFPIYSIMYTIILISNNNTNNIKMSLMSEVNILTLTSLKYIFLRNYFISPK